MFLQKNSKLFGMILGCVLLLNGCASSFFPDFEDTDEVVIDAGGNVEIREVNKKGILVADKENAAYEDDESVSTVDEIETVEPVEPAKVVKVETEDVEPIVVSNKDVKSYSDRDNDLKNITTETDAIEDEKKLEDEIKAPTMHYLAGTIYFENGGAAVGSNYRQLLKKIAKLVKDNDAIVTVYGFASSRTRDTDPASHKLANFKISAERAENTAKALIKVGVAADKIMVQAMSDSMPMYQEVMPEGERLNRRSEIYLTY